MQIMDGEAVATAYKEELRKVIEQLRRRPTLSAILVGNNPSSETYVRRKHKACEELGIYSEIIRLDENITENELLEVIYRLNNDPQVDGFIVQLPLPKHICEQTVIGAIKPRKDVDGFHPSNFGRMTLGLESYVPATPLGISMLLKYYNIETAGKHCVIVGRSNIVGRPLCNLLSLPGWDCTVTLCHSKTKNLTEICREADILIVAIGQPEFIKADMVKEGAVVVDVGITSVKSTDTKSGWKLKGDVAFDEVAPKTSYITPVPGGVGPMTIFGLIYNTIQAATKGGCFENLKQQC